MSIHKFAVKVTRLEGKKKSVNISQVKEILRIMNKILGGSVYALIKARKVFIIES